MNAPPAAAPDQELAQALLEHGDEAAFRALYARHTPRLSALLLGMLAGSEHDAEDAVQETWIRATGALKGFRWDSAFATWLAGIGSNCARMLLRKQGRWETLEPGNEPWRGPAREGDRIDVARALALRDLVDAVRVETSTDAAMAVQQTGSAYVQALSRFASMRDSAGAAADDQGREVAVRMLGAAAAELLRIAPDDPVAAAVLAAFQRDTLPAARPGEKQRLVWF